MEQSNVFIEPEAFSSTNFHAGQYTQHGQEYGFTLAVTYDMDSGTVTSTELTWVDDQPEDADQAEEQILEEFYTVI